MVSTAVCLMLLGSGQDERKASLTGNVEKIVGFESKVLGNSRNLIVYLPPGYDDGRNLAYPVVYMMDGQNVMDGMTSFIPNQEWRADDSAEALINAGLIEPVIIVGIDNGGSKRAYEYMPTKAKFAGTEDGGGADKFTEFVVDEVMPEIAKRFRVKDDPAKTAVVGASFGGVIAMHMGLTRPDKFGLIGACSPSFWWDDEVMINRLKELEKKPKLKVWMDVGLEEPPSMYEGSRKAAEEMKKKGWSAKDFVYYEEPSAGHNERAWAGRFDLILRWFYGK